MTTPASLPPPAVPYLAGVSRSRAPAGETDAAGRGSPAGPGETRGRITAARGAPVAGVLPSHPVAAAREREETIRPGRLDRGLVTDRVPATSERHRGALAAKAESEAVAAALGGMRAVIARAGERTAPRPGSGVPAGEAGPQARGGAEEATLASVIHVREGLGALAATIREQVDSDIAALMQAAELIDAANHDNRGARTHAGAADPQVVRALQQLSALAGATSRIAGDGTIEAQVGGRFLVGRRGVQEVVARRGEAATASATEAAQPPAGSVDRAALGDLGVAVTWKSGGRVEALGGALAGHLTALGSSLPRVAQMVGEIAAAAGMKAAVAGVAAGHPDGAPTAADLMKELDAALGGAESAARQRVEVASAVVAIGSGPPAAFFAGVVATMGAAFPADPGRITACAVQRLVTDLQVVQSATRELAGGAERLASAEPFIPLTVTSSHPEVLDCEVVAAAAPTPAGGPDASLLTEPLHLDLDVVTVAHGDIGVSSAGFSPLADVSQGVPVTVSVGVGPAAGASGEQAGPEGPTRIILAPPVTLASTAESVTEIAADLTAGVHPAPGGLAHLAAESRPGIGTVAQSRSDGAEGGILGGFTEVAAGVDTLIRSATPGVPWVGTAPTRHLDGPVAGLRLTVTAAAAGQRVGLDCVPDLAGVTDQVSDLVGAVNAVLTADHGMDTSGAPIMPEAGITVSEGVGAAPGPSPLASDVALDALAASFVAAVSGVPIVPASGAAAPGTLTPGDPGIPGVTVGMDEADPRRAIMDREVFLRTLIEDPTGTRSAVRAACAEVAAAARESLDERSGLFAFRLGQELRSASDAVTPTAPGRGTEQRETENTRRAATLTALLERLQDQSGWLRRRIA